MVRRVREKGVYLSYTPKWPGHLRHVIIARYDLLACEIKHIYDHNCEASVNNSFQATIIPKRTPYQFCQDFLVNRTQVGGELATMRIFT